MLFLPGFIISYLFFPKTKKFDEDEEGESGEEGRNKDENGKRENEREKGAIDWIERIALSFALSIAIVPLAVFYLNLAGLKINLFNSFMTILVIILIGTAILALRFRKEIEEKVLKLHVRKILKGIGK